MSAAGWAEVLTAAGHAFVRPGQVAPGLAAPNACVRCGEGQAVHLPAAERDARVTAAAATLGDFRRFEDQAAQDGSAPWADWAMWAGRLAAAVGSVLEAVKENFVNDEHSVNALTKLPDAKALNAEDREVLASALADAIEYRQPSGLCSDCDDHPAGLCEPHAADLDWADDYAALARELGVDL